MAECATWVSFGSRSSSTLTIRSCLVDGGPRPWAGLSWAPPRTSSRLGRLPIGCRACCSCRFRRRRQARTDSILTSVRSIKPQKSNVSFPSVLGGPMSGSVTRRGWYSQTLKAMSSASYVDGFGPIPRSRRHRTTLRLSGHVVDCPAGTLAVLRCEACRPGAGRRAPGSPAGDNQRVTGPASGQGQPKPGPVSVGAGQAVVDVDAVVADAQRVQSVALCGEILLLC